MANKPSSLALSLLLRPSNLLEGTKPFFRTLNPITDWHHRALDYLLPSLTNKSIFFPHGFFSKGFGDYQIVKQFYEEIAEASRSGKPPIAEISPELVPSKLEPWSYKAVNKTVICHDGRFGSPAAHILPEESMEAHFRFVQPEGWAEQQSRPAVVLLPGMGEFRYMRRFEGVALPLAEAGIASIILEGPYYGVRKPVDQKRSKLKEVTDLLKLGRATIAESCSLLMWLREEVGATSVTVAGCSMGGLHAAMTGAMMPLPTGIVGHIAPPSAHHPFCQGVLYNGLEQERLLTELEIEEEDAKAEALVEQLQAYMAPTNITLFPTPEKPEAAVITVGRSDQYITPAAVDVWDKEIRGRWQGCRIEKLAAGHVTGILVERDAYRDAILEVSKKAELINN